MSRRTSAASSCTGRGDLAASLAIVFPVFFVYEIGVLFAGRVNGADIVTRALYAALGSRAWYLLVHAAIAAMFLLWIRRGGGWKSLRFEILAPVIVEAAIYAFTLATVVSVVLRDGLGLAIGGNALVSACGAGVHEELVFRLGVCSGLVAAFRGTTDRRLAVAFAFAISSLLFAAAHHLGAGGEPFTVHAFVFRTFAGCAFAAMFWFRSFAHAVYAHTFYDLMIASSG